MPPLFVALFKALWWLLPFLTLLIGFDQISADLQHRTIRYDAIRARRSSLVAGKALALWIVVSVLVLALYGLVWIASVGFGDTTLVAAASWGGRFWLLNCVYVATWAGFTALVSSVTRRPILSLFIGLVLFSALSLGDLVSWAMTRAAEVDSGAWFAQLAPARYAFPGFYQQWLVTPQAAYMIGAIALLIAIGAGATAGAGWILNRSDV